VNTLGKPERADGEESRPHAAQGPRDRHPAMLQTWHAQAVASPSAAPTNSCRRWPAEINAPAQGNSPLPHHLVLRQRGSAEPGGDCACDTNRPVTRLCVHQIAYRDYLCSQHLRFDAQRPCSGEQRAQEQQRGPPTAPPGWLSPTRQCSSLGMPSLLDGSVPARRHRKPSYHVRSGRPCPAPTHPSVTLR